MKHKDTEGKLQLNLVPSRAMEAIALVREFGTKKYGDPWGWLQVVNRKQLQEAGKRHQLKEDKGEFLDPESGLPHAFHRLCSYAMEVEILMRQIEDLEQNQKGSSKLLLSALCEMDANLLYENKGEELDILNMESIVPDVAKSNKLNKKLSKKNVQDKK